MWILLADLTAQDIDEEVTTRSVLDLTQDIVCVSLDDELSCLSGFAVPDAFDHLGEHGLLALLAS